MTSVAESSTSLRNELEKIAGESKANAISVAVLDLQSGFRFSQAGDRWVHPASTIKVAVLLSIFRAADERHLRPGDPLPVRNRFLCAHHRAPFLLFLTSHGVSRLY